MKLSTLRLLNSWAILLHVILMKKLFVSNLSINLNVIFVSYVVGRVKLDNYEVRTYRWSNMTTYCNTEYN